MFVTVLYAIYDPSKGVLSYASGGHDSPVVVRANGEVKLLPRVQGIALGILDGFEFESESVVLDPGDTVVLYTDGVTEAQDANGNMFGAAGLCELFEAAPPTRAEEAIQRVFGAVRSFAGTAEQFDDITCLALRRGDSL